MAINKNKVMEAAQKYVEKGQTDKAIKEYLKVVQEDPKDVRVWLKIGDLYAKKGAKQEATETYLKVAQFYSEQGFYLKAVAVYKQILKIDARLVEVNMKLAELYRQLGLLSDAMQQYELVAAFYHREGKTREALATIKELAELDPDNVATRIKLAELYSKEGMSQEAIAEFTKAADYLRTHNRMDDFVKVAERLVWHQPENHKVNRELATLYLQRSDPRRALQKLQACFKADARDVETLALLARAFQALDQTAKTISVWKELARIHQENGNKDRSLEVYRQILSLAPDDAEVQAILGGRRAPTPPAAPGPPPPPQPYPSVATPMAGDPPAAAGSGGFPRVATPLNAPLISSRDVPEEYRRPTGSIPLVGSPDSPPPGRRPAPPAAADEEDPAVAFTRNDGDTTSRRSTSHADVELDLDDMSGGTDEVLLEESPESVEAHSDEIAKVLTETDVYVKYGLHQKAIEHLKRVFELDPRNVEAREKLKDIFVAMGRHSEAASELVRLVENTAPRNPELAGSYLNELFAIDPNDSRGRALATKYRLVARPSSGAGEVSTPTPPTEQPTRRPSSGMLPSATQEINPDMLQEVELEAEEPDGGAPFDAANPPATTFDDELYAEEPAAAEQAEYEAELSDFEEAEAEEPLPETSEHDAQLPDAARRRTGDPHAATSLEDDLDEADFFVGQNLFAEARSILNDLLGRYPNHPLVLAKLQEVDLMEGTASDLPPPLPEPDLQTPPPELQGHAPPPPPPRSTRDTGGQPAVAAPKRPTVIARPMGEEDADTHWDLGLAYKEMGLYDEAIREFSLILNTPGRAVQCELMIGRCQAERGKFSEAINEFKRGLYIDGITELQALDLYFEIGAAYEALGDTREALYYYEKVAKRDPRFREVEKRVESLKAKGTARAAGPHDTHDDGALDGIIEDGSSGDFTA